MSDEREFLKYGGNELCSEKAQWMTSLAVRDNLLFSDIPHVPILVEDIPKYIMLMDYEENCIKRIQTIGRISRMSGRSGVVTNIISTETFVAFPIDLTDLDINEYYYKGADNTRTTIWEQNCVFKIFGTLVYKDDRISLAASHLKAVNNVVGSWLVTRQLSKMARREYRQYYRTPELDKLTEQVWEKMRVEQKRQSEMKF